MKPFDIIAIELKQGFSKIAATLWQRMCMPFKTLKAT